jgi:translation initiation factor 3 subunit I
MKTYVADTPLNSASITPKKDFVILGGGQDAMGVTQTDGMHYQTQFRLFYF